MSMWEVWFVLGTMLGLAVIAVFAFHGAKEDRDAVARPYVAELRTEYGITATADALVKNQGKAATVVVGGVRRECQISYAAVHDPESLVVSCDGQTLRPNG